jgi:DNA-binding response OmpR family regulator
MKKPSDTKIAIIEDQEEIAEMYRFKFESEGYQVEVAENGITGFKMVQEFGPDIILLDLMMPIQDGPETLDQFKSANITTPVVILTNLGKEEAMKRIRSSDSIVDFLIKADATPKQVVEKVRNLLEKATA